jgi:leucyl-tRNA synthetase
MRHEVAKVRPDAAHASRLMPHAVMKYDHRGLEKKWQDRWADARLFEVQDDPSKKKCYILDMFPYPSGAGLHVGHPEGYTATDIVARKRRMEGWNVLHPMGWDAFGLPAENYAIKTGVHPDESTKKNIATFRRQLQSLGFSYDWTREISTCDPEYYKWTQWLFLFLYKNDLAYKRKAPVNWCASCQTVLANEQVEDGRCERCKNEVIQKELEQWFFRVTEYADRFLSDIEKVQWPDKIKLIQRNWIGRSEGAELTFAGDGFDVRVFTTRPDTLYGVSYVVLAPEHPLVDRVTAAAQRAEVDAYRAATQKKTELERLSTAAAKTGVWTGATVQHPTTGADVPVWIADYVLAGYGTGAVMGVPAHDERDWSFARTYGLPVTPVIEPVTGEPQENAEFRRSIVAVVRNPKTGQLLTLDWGALGGTLFVGGGREEGEDPVACALREIKEETGYTNLRHVATTGVIHHNYFAKSKNVARRIDAVGLLFDLVNETREATALEANEAGKFAVEWLTPAEAKAKVNDELHALVRAQLLEGGCYGGSGVLTNSGEFDGQPNESAKQGIVAKAGGKFVTTFRLRDWLVSRQRYWGPPIPIIYCDDCGMVPVPEKDLPVRLPTDVDFRPTGESPLTRSASFQDVACPQCAKKARRESDTIDTFVDSSWYFLRYCSPQLASAAFDRKAVDHWCPVDLYVGGAEHAVLHLLFARFVTKALSDHGLVSFDEPFVTLKNPGLIMGEDGQKMSKSRGNVINPDDVVAEYGADTLRLYEMFMGEFEDAKPWDTKGIVGVRRFLDRAATLVGAVAEGEDPAEANPEAERVLHKTIKKVSADIEAFRFNTAISAMMILLNEWQRIGSVTKAQASVFVRILSPFAPHLADELHEALGHADFALRASWPQHDEALLVEDSIEVPVQVNGKLRDTVVAPVGLTEDALRELALGSEKVRSALAGATPKKVIVVRGKIVSIVV